MNSRVRAPELAGRGWLNTGGKALTLADLRGKILILDFWTFCCINCLHVLDELRPLEEKYGNALVIIGVHSPKFEHERDPEALAAAVERYGVHHPVLDDGDMHVWQQYAAKAWPTLAVVDPAGYLVASMAGEGHAEGLSRLIDELIEKHEADGTLHRGDGPYVPPPAPDGLLRFPGKAIELPNGNLLVSDSARHSVVELAPDGETLVRRFGGDRDEPFSEPQGLLLLPSEVASIAGYHVVIADTVNHQLRALNTTTGEITLVAGSGKPWRSAVDDHPHDALATDLSSPWDLAWYDDKVIIAMAGIHQLWWFDPIKRTVGVYAGTTVEARATARCPTCGWRSRPASRSAATASGSGSPTARPRPCATSRRTSCTPRWARACSTSGTWTARPPGRCSSIRSASAPWPTARCWSRTPTTARSGGSTRRAARSPRWTPVWPSRVTCW